MNPKSNRNLEFRLQHLAGIISRHGNISASGLRHLGKEQTHAKKSKNGRDKGYSSGCRMLGFIQLQVSSNGRLNSQLSGPLHG